MSSLAAFNRIVAVAACAGILAGLLLTAAQQVRVAPLLLEAEGYEHAAAGAPAHANAGAAAAHEHEAAPHGLERTLLSAVSNVALAVGFALLLAAAMFMSKRSVGWRSGLLWGLAGYAVFFLAPALGLPPEVPGTEAARLTDRQLWWLLTALCTASGLALLVFGRGWAARLPGVLLVLLPHLLGAPQPEVHSMTAPAALVDAFIQAAAFTNLVFWLSLGGLLGWFYKRIA